MKKAILTTFFTLISFSKSQAFMKLNDFTEIKTTVTNTAIECTQIYDLELKQVLLSKEQNFFAERLKTEVVNNNLAEQAQLMLLFKENQQKQAQLKLKLTSLKKTIIEAKAYLLFNGVSRFLLQNSATPLTAASGTITSDLKNIKAPVEFSVYPSWLNNKPNHLRIDPNFNEVSFIMTQEQFCFSDEVNLGASIEFDVEHKFINESVIISHHIGFDLKKARTEQIQIADTQTREMVFEDSVEPIMTEAFGLSNFYLINDEFITNLTRKGSQSFISDLDNLRAAFKQAKEKFHSSGQVGNSELKTQLKQFANYKVYNNGLIGSVLKNGVDTVEVIFGKDPHGIFVERILLNNAPIFAIENACLFGKDKLFCAPAKLPLVTIKH